MRGGHGRALRGRAGRSTALGSGPFSVRSKMSQATGAAFTFRAEALPRGQGASKRIVPQKRNETLGIPRPIRSRLRDGIVAVCRLAANSVECHVQRCRRHATARSTVQNVQRCCRHATARSTVHVQCRRSAAFVVAVCGLVANSVECPAVPQTRDCALDRSCAVPPLSGLCGGGVRARCQ